jgi:hypothetical protein
MRDPVPNHLVVAIEEQYLAAVTDWWNSLSSADQSQLLDDATNQPKDIASRVEIESLDDRDETNEWYEYVVNQDMRFYFDRHNGEQTSHGYRIYPMLTAVSTAADASVVSHILKRGSG